MEGTMDTEATRHPGLARFVLERAIRHGAFTLSCGDSATYYCDGKMVTFDPEGIALVVEAIFEEIRDLEFDAVGGMDMGATPILSALALYSRQHGRSFPTFVVRKDAKAHGTKKKIEGPIPKTSCRAIIVDDVVTSGGSIQKAIEATREAGHEVVLAMCILDRESGGEECMRRLGVEYRPLLRASEIGLTNETNRVGSGSR